jgi:hypothetical protein
VLWSMFAIAVAVGFIEEVVRGLREIIKDLGE